MSKSKSQSQIGQSSVACGALDKASRLRELDEIDRRHEAESIARFLAMLEKRPESREDMDELVAEFYGLEGNTVGGTLHLVLDDGNWERRHVESCRDYARENRDVAGERFAELLLTLTDEELWAWLGQREEFGVE